MGSPWRLNGESDRYVLPLGHYIPDHYRHNDLKFKWH